jgi:hypothetical protein
LIAGYAALERQVAALYRDFRAIRQAEEADQAPLRTAARLAGDLGISLDPWQRTALATRQDLLLLVSRQGGKGETASLLALEAMLGDAGSRTVVVAPSERQTKRLVRRIKRSYRLLDGASPAVVDSQYALELRNGSELLALSGSEETIRGLEAVDLLIVDEAALVEDELFAAVFPMLAVTNGRCVAMTTPRGRRGWFHSEWTGGGASWHRERITAHEVPRISPAFLERTRLRIGDWMFRQEFLCEFLDQDDQVFSSDLIAAAMTDDAPILVERIFAA